jgi:hypothetical protein
VSAVVTASRRHVAIEMRRVKMAKAMKRNRGMPVRSVWTAKNVCCRVSHVKPSRWLKAYGELRISIGELVKIFGRFLTLLRGEQSVAGGLKLMANITGGVLELVAHIAGDVLCAAYEGRHDGLKCVMAAMVL